MKIELSALDALLTCTAKGASRFDLGGVQFRRGVAAATDGRRLLLVRVNDMPDGLDVVVDAASLRRAVQLARSEGSTPLSIGSGGGRWSVGFGGVSVPLELLKDAEFPDWTDVVPDTEPERWISFDPSLAAGTLWGDDATAETLRALKEPNHSGLNDSIRIGLYDREGATFVICRDVDRDGGYDMLAVVMPTACHPFSLLPHRDKFIPPKPKAKAKASPKRKKAKATPGKTGEKA